MTSLHLNISRTEAESEMTSEQMGSEEPDYRLAGEARGNPEFGADGLRYALMIGVAIIGWGTVHFFFATKHQQRELVS